MPCIFVCLSSLWAVWPQELLWIKLVHIDWQFSLPLQSMAVLDKGKQNDLAMHQVENGLQHHQHTPGGPFLSGIKQRLLSFIFRGIWNEEADHALVGFNSPFHFCVTNYIYFEHISTKVIICLLSACLSSGIEKIWIKALGVWTQFRVLNH